MSSAQVLVVEDENIVAKAIQNELRSMGYDVPATASSGEEAIRKAEENHPDLVLMDIVLKGDMDGIETARRVRDRLDIPVVYLTAYEDAETLDRAKLTEPFGYLLKPYEEKELHTTIEMALFKHRAEREVRETRQWLAAVLRSIDDAVIATDGLMAVRFLNRRAEALTGWVEADALGRDLIEVCHFGCGDLEKAVREALRQERTVGLHAEAVLFSRQDKSVPVEGSVAPIRDEEGHLAGMVVAFRDVTLRRQVEELRRQSEEQLRHSQKMEAVGRLAGGIAHNFNNLLTAILGNSSLVRDHMAAEDPSRELMNQVETASVRAADLVRQLLSFSGDRPLRAEAINLNELVDDAVSAGRRTADSRVEVEFNPGEELWLVHGDPAQLTEVVTNLCLNAREAMPEGGRLFLETENVTVDAEQARGRPWRPGEYVRLRVTDTGFGIPPEVLPRIFEPFYTTKEPGTGTGLGLALVYGIVHDHHGWVECASEEGHGTRFEVYLPRYGKTAGPTAPATALRKQRQGTATILLADDEPMIRDLGRTILERCGYDVLLAEDGQEAVDIYLREQDHIDLVILDLTMPRLSGDDTFHRMAEIDPDVLVLFSSGYFAEDLAVSDGRVLGVLNKPYSHEGLSMAVRSALELARERRQQPTPPASPTAW